jgi:hypothetical protein
VLGTSTEKKDDPARKCTTLVDLPPIAKFSGGGLLVTIFIMCPPFSMLPTKLNPSHFYASRVSHTPTAVLTTERTSVHSSQSWSPTSSGGFFHSKVKPLVERSGDANVKEFKYYSIPGFFTSPTCTAGKYP